MCRAWRSAVLSSMSVIAVCLLAAVALAQPPGGPGRGPRGGFGGGPPMMGPGGGTGLELLFSPDVREEIELVEEQEEQLRDLQNKMRDGMRSVFTEIRDLPEEERRDAMMARMQEQQESIKKEMESILLDHQLERLKQLQLQSQLQGGAANALASNDVREALGLTDEQLEEMRQVASEAEAELREQIRKATEEARSKVLDVLTAEQRAKWEQMTGASFNFQNRGPFGGGGPGGRFGRGGGPPPGGPPARDR
jgi:hypothetical protein